MNIYLRELKAHRKAIIIWSIAMILFVLLGMQKYSTLVGSDGNTEIMMKMFDNMPNFLKSIFGVSSLDISTPIGYFGLLFSYLALMGGIHASMLGASIIFKEERDKTVEFLMTKPVSRNNILTSKIMAALTNVIIFNIVTFVTSAIYLKSLTNEPLVRTILISMLAMFFIQLIFMIIGIAMVAIMKIPKKAGSMTMAILLGSFLLSIVVDISDKFKMFRFISPFKYFDAKSFMISGSLNIGYIALTLLIVVGLLIPAYKQYNQRDLNM